MVRIIRTQFNCASLYLVIVGHALLDNVSKVPEETRANGEFIGKHKEGSLKNIKRCPINAFNIVS